jgi:hypothetical protein
MPSKVFPHQINDLVKLRQALKIIDQLVKENQTIEDDEVLGYALFLSGLIRSRYPSGRTLKEELEVIKAKPKADQSPLTIARDLRRLFELFGLIEQQDGRLQLSERGRKIADAPRNAPLTDEEKKAWLEGLRRLRYPDDTMLFRPLRIMLEMLNHGEMDSKLLAFALTVANESNDELKRILDTIDRVKSRKSTFDKEIAAIELSEANARNNVKILPALAEQVAVIARSGGIARITPLGRSVLFEITRKEAEPQTPAVARHKEPFFRTVTNDEELRRNWKPAPAESVDFDPKDEAERLAQLHERTDEHQEILIKLRKIYAEKDWTTGIGNFDLLSIKGEVALLHEIKTINANERLQIIDAIGKLTYYGAFDVPSILKDSQTKVQKILVFSKRPDQAHIDFLKKLGIWILWFDPEGKLCGEDESKDTIGKLLE